MAAKKDRVKPHASARCSYAEVCIDRGFACALAQTSTVSDCNRLLISNIKKLPDRIAPTATD
jgi:hypothetical protein